MKRFERVACTAQNAISLVEFSFKQTCSKKFEFWRRELKLNKFRKHWSNGEAFCRVDCLDHLVFTFPDVICLWYLADNVTPDTKCVSFGALDFENSGGSLRRAGFSKIKCVKTASKRGSFICDKMITGVEYLALGFTGICVVGLPKTR